MGERVHIGAMRWRAKDGTVYEADEAGFIDCDPKHARELKGGGKAAKSEKPVVDYTSWNKPKMKTELEDRGLDTEGNKDDLIARLVEADGE